MLGSDSNDARALARGVVVLLVPFDMDQIEDPPTAAAPFDDVGRFGEPPRT